MRKRAEGHKLAVSTLMDEWEKLCVIEKDAHIAISADEGDGKTHLMIQLILAKVGKKKYKNALWDNIVYTDNPKEYYDKYEALPAHNFIMGFDEALSLMNRLDWAKNEMKRLVSHHRASVRKEKHGIFLYNVQLFRDLHGYWRTHRIRYWLELPAREWFSGANAAFILRRQRVPFITGRRDTWLLDTQEREWMSEMTKGAIEAPKYINRLRTHPFYMGEFRFEALPDEVKEHYMACRVRAMEEYVRLEEELTPRQKQLVDQRDKLMKIAKEAGVHPDTIASDLNISPRAVQMGIRKSKLRYDK